MISPALIVNWMRNYFPWYAKDFLVIEKTESVNVEADNYVRVITTEPHTHELNDIIRMAKGVTTNKIIASGKTEGGFIFTTEFDHDLTGYMVERKNRNYPNGKTVRLVGFGNYLDGEQDLVLTADGVTNRRQFKIVCDNTDLPILTEDTRLIEYRTIGVNGEWEVTEVVSENEYVFLAKNNDTPILPTGIVLGSMIYNARVALAPNYEQAKRRFTEHRNKKKPYAFVVMGVTNTSKDPTEVSEAKATGSERNIHLSVVHSVTVYLFIPNTEDSEVEVIDRCWEDYLEAVLKTLLGIRFEYLNGVKYGGITEGLILDNCGIQEIDSGYYVQAYEFTGKDQITTTQSFDLFPSVAFRDIGGTVYNDTKYEANLDYKEFE